MMHVFSCNLPPAGEWAGGGGWVGGLRGWGGGWGGGRVAARVFFVLVSTGY